MKRRIASYGLIIALGFALVSPQAWVFAADEAKTLPKDIPDKIPDYSKYKFIKELAGELIKADDKKVTVRVKWTVNTQLNPKARPNIVEKHQDYEYSFIPESLVRTSFLPKKTDDKGKRVEWTPKEKDALKMPIGVTGYAASTSDLVEHSTVNLILIRDKSISDAKATDDDLRIKYAVIKEPPPATPPGK
ncbi:MAG TPA: hypothetical protein VG097_14400 [Gemmata sp.]|nr:hypothetical protein [Gemmata sp.]